MARKTDKRSGDLRDRAFSWYWRRMAARTRDTGAFLSLVRRRRAELDAVARRAEAKLARGRLSPATDQDEGAGAVWLRRPDCFYDALSQSAFTAPESGLRLGRDLATYHDDESGLFTLAQRPSRSRSRATRFEVFFESYEFDGDYLSLVIDAQEDLRRPRPTETLRLALDLVATRPLKAFIRLNVSGGAGAERLYAEGDLGDGAAAFDFDLAFAAFEIGERDNIWVELIIDRPRMVEMAIRDLSLSLHGDDE